LRTRLIALCAVLVVLPACQVTVGVTTSIGRNGAGSVTAAITLDRAAAADAGDLRTRTDGLARAGWKVTPARVTADGGRVIQAVRIFRGPADFQRAMDELSGPTGPFHDLSFRRGRSLLSTHTDLTGAVDLQGGLAAFGDPRLAQQLGPGLGLQPADLDQANRSFHFTLTAKVPGATRELHPALGRRTPVAVSGRSLNLDVLLPAVVAIVTGLALAFMLLTGIGASRNRSWWR